MANTLFPPIMDSWMPAFVGECNIYFTLSNYNSLSSIAGVQLSVRNAKSNKNALADLYTAEVKNISKDNIHQDGEKYYITLTATDMRSGFTADQFYKIQMRFIDVSVGAMDAAPKVDWLNLYQQAFSEWSRVCLIKPISAPSLSLFGLEENVEVVSQNAFNTISGSVSFAMAEEDEYLKQYQITIFKSGVLTPYYQSDIIEAEDYNLNFINYIIPVELYNNTSYEISVTIYTNNGYSKTFEYGIKINMPAIGNLPFEATVTPNLENGSIQVQVTSGISDISDLQGARLLIRRSDGSTNFKIWEDVYGQMGAIKWNDFTIKSGECYRYQVQQVNAQGGREQSVMAMNTDPISLADKYTIRVDFEDTYIADSTLQVRVKFDPDISNYKHTVMEAKTDTIGSKYPFIKRNGYTDYRSFPISGLISYESDEKGEFIAKSDLFNSGVIDFYDDVIESCVIKDSISAGHLLHQKIDDSESVMLHEEPDVKKNPEEHLEIGKHGDYIYEREFREKIIEFLYNSKIKLFRSLTEGNILVKLMDISLTPNKTLGRMVYTFTATAHEVDDATVSNYLQYNLLHIPDMTELKVQDTFGVIGQLYGTYSGDLMVALGEKYAEYGLQVNSKSIAKVESLGWMRIAFYSPAYAIYSVNGVPTPVISTSEVDEEDIIYGHIVYVNGNAVLLKTDEELEVPYIDKSIMAVSLPRGRNEEIIFDFQINLYYELKSSESNIKSKVYESKVGQLYETFEEGVSYYAKIYNKYKVNKTAWYQKLLTITNLRLQIPKNIDIYYRLYPKETGMVYNSWAGPITSGLTQSKYSDKDLTTLNLWWSEDGSTIHFKPGAVKDIKFMRRKSTLQTEFKEDAIDEYGNIYHVIDVDKYYIASKEEGGVWDDEMKHVTVHTKDKDSGIMEEKALLVYAKELGQECYLDLPSTVYTIESLTELHDIYEPLMVYDASVGKKIPVLNTDTGLPILIFSRKEPLLSPHEHYVYTINGKQYIYYDGEWYPFDAETSIILSKIDGLIDYTIDLERGTYL